MNIDAVFEGGGVKGLAFLGSICCMEDYNYNVHRCAGTSAGSIIASLLAVGYSGKEIKDIMLNTDLNKFKGKSAFGKLGSLCRLTGRLGLHDNQYIEEWLTELFKKKNKLKFGDIAWNGESKLKIIASDITKKAMLILPDDLKNYGIDPLDFEIAKAVRMSTTIPFYYEPYKLHYKSGTSLIVDGGVLSNFPIWIFDVEGIPRWPTFGFNIVEKEKLTTPPKRYNIFKYSSDLLNTMIDRQEDVYVRDKDKVRTIYIPSLGVKTTEFHLPKEKSEKLIHAGYRSTKNFLDNWSFERYVLRHRSDQGKKFV